MGYSSLKGSKQQTQTFLFDHDTLKNGWYELMCADGAACGLMKAEIMLESNWFKKIYY